MRLRFLGVVVCDGCGAESPALRVEVQIRPTAEIPGGIQLLAPHPPDGWSQVFEPPPKRPGGRPPGYDPQAELPPNYDPVRYFCDRATCTKQASRERLKIQVARKAGGTDD